jgi:NodT family efflux transporter outer membrane factor (OMF) lipoprotein
MHALVVWILTCAALSTWAAAPTQPAANPPAATPTASTNVVSALALPALYRNTGDLPAIPSAQASVTGHWWQRYGSDELDTLVAQALRLNSDLRIANLQVAQAKIRLKQNKAGALPTILAPVRVASQGSGGTADTLQSSQLGLQGSYRLDIWGEQRASTESAQQQVLRASFDRDNVERNVVGGLVSAYIAYLLAGDNLDMARQNEQVAKDILQTVEKRLALGDTTRDELDQQQGNVAFQQATLATLENQREDIRTTISRLVGVLPAELKLTDRGIDALAVPQVDAGVPSALLLNRPDIRTVEARMAAANANIELARARLLPPIDLAGQVGYSGLTLAQLLQPQSFFWNAVASLSVTIFDGGRRQGDKALAQSSYEEMVETYRQTIYQAIREVESAVSSLRTASLRLEAQKRSARAALNMFKTASDAFALGAVDLTTLLEARRNYQRSQDDMQKTKAELLSANAGLALAIGGNTMVSKEKVPLTP